MSAAAPPKLVVFALDESDHSVAALNWTFDYILKDGDKLTVAVVIDKESDRDTISRVKTLLRAVWQTTTLQVSMSMRVLVGKKAGEQIVGLVAELNPAMLVLGSAGKNHVTGFLVGSTSNYCVANATCAVIVARLDEEAEARGRGLSEVGGRRRSKSPLLQIDPVKFL
ncbi:hypothetical protein BJ742DRAFT_475134 [Cladochytrium replicatum]|nr:hypothetical protein BJ742DRAFT_475134 [Cladochytrium replicatum]